MASTSPKSESVLIENPNNGNTTNVPINDTRTAHNGMSVARQPWKKMNTSMMTSTNTENKVLTISRIPSLTENVCSSPTAYSLSDSKRCMAYHISLITPCVPATAHIPG